MPALSHASFSLQAFLSRLLLMLGSFVVSVTPWHAWSK